MANLSPMVLILIALACIVVALIVGYFLGSRFGGKKSVAMREAREKHDGYKNDVREHFEQTSAIMSRMVEDYRDMYRHMADGAEKLADIHPERQITPPPAPEAITREPETTPEGADRREAKASSTAAASGEVAGKSSSQEAVMNSDSSNDRPWNKEGGKPAGLD